MTGSSGDEAAGRVTAWLRATAPAMNDPFVETTVIREGLNAGDPKLYRADVRALLDEREQLADAITTLTRRTVDLEAELAEERASHNPLLRCIIVKAAPDQDLYIGWSNNVEAPTGVWTRTEALAYGFPPSRLDRADKTGTSSKVPGSGQWNDNGFIAEQRGWLRRDRIARYAVLLLDGHDDAAYDLLEPFEGETEVRR